MENEIEKLEVKISYLEKQNEDLSEMIYSLEEDLKREKKRVDFLERKIGDLVEELSPDRPSRKPPHY